MHQFIPFVGLSDRRWLAAQVEAGGLRSCVFQIRACRVADQGSPEFEEIERVLGKDPTGTLYIGSSPDVSRVVAALAGEERSKSIGRFLGVYLSHPELMQRFPRDRLGVAFTFREIPEVHAVEMLAGYQVRYGELPPLNEEVSFDDHA